VSDLLLALVFVVATAISLVASWVLVSRLERVGARLGLREALLGLLAALAADAPEITAAASAMVGRQSRIGAGVVIGSNVFNLAALLGVAAVVAGSIALHRRAIALEAAVALPLAVLCLLVVVGVLPAVAALALAVLVLVPYVALLGLPRARIPRLRLPGAWARWLARASEEEEIEIEAAGVVAAGEPRDAWFALGATAVVVGASIAMERSAARFGTRHAVPQIVVGGLVLAAVTSLPNAIAAVYLAVRGRGAATLSTAMNSNALNVAVGLLVPASIIGLSTRSGAATLVAAWYLGLTVVALVSAYLAGGLRRIHGALIIVAYAAFVVVLIVTA
jgi:cation:H+ antiporter